MSKIEVYLNEIKDLVKAGFSSVSSTLADITKIGGSAVPVKGVTPVVPTIIVDATGTQITQFVEGNPDTPFNDVLTLTTFGTPEQIKNIAKSGYVIMKAAALNGGTIYIGTSTVDDTNGYSLTPSEQLTLAVDDLSLLFFDGTADNLKLEIIGAYTN